MIEEFDAIQNLRLSQVFLTSFGLLLLGVALEFGLRLGQRWMLAREHTWASALLGALTWQPIFWTLLYGTISPILRILQTTTDWQRSSALPQTLVMVALTIVVVRLVNNAFKIMTGRRPSASVSLLNNLITGLGWVVSVAIIIGFAFNISFVILLLAFAGAVTGLTVIFQEPLKNLVGGVSLTLSSRLNPGDFVRLPSGLEGSIDDIQWDVTTVRQLANNTVSRLKQHHERCRNHQLQPTRSSPRPEGTGGR